MLTSFPVLALILLVAPINILAATTPVCTTYYGSTSKSIVVTSFTLSTRTTTITESVVYATTTVSSGITTIPTPKGFTPILSETTSISLQIQAANAASQHPPSSTSYPVSILCTATTTSTITKTATGKQRADTTVTSYSTATVPATTFHAACDSNNIIDQGSGVGAGHAIQFTTVGGPFYDTTTIFNSSAYDCCVSCLTTPPCAFSVLFTNYDTTNPLACALDFRTDGVCDGGFSQGPAKYYYDPHDLGAQPGQSLIVSNGACGQILYGGGFARE